MKRWIGTASAVLAGVLAAYGVIAYAIPHYQQRARIWGELGRQIREEGYGCDSVENATRQNEYEGGAAWLVQCEAEDLDPADLVYVVHVRTSQLGLTFDVLRAFDGARVDPPGDGVLP